MSVKGTTLNFLFLIGYVLAIDDPCAAGHYREFPSQNIGARQEGCLSSVFEECDFYFNDTLWYTSFFGKLLTHCPRDRSCGSPLPVWIDGPYPNENDGLVNRTVCIKKESLCCSTILTMEIKNCSTFAVFRLPNVPSCPSAYCFESNLPCETTSTSTTTTTSTPVTHRTTEPHIPSSEYRPTTKPKEYINERPDLLIGMLIGGFVVLVSIATCVILYAKFWRKPQRISTDQYPVVITNSALPYKQP
ncbi:oncoprotein-induced transcript 3 protein-like [Dreissena polymorpha]|uniref:UMOD/GP2/OIT3-like D8C domain-containing protein n=1 Tax=Dreissena polymorpha TaxID=45954 RepID=A0A9D4G7T0_DREPO|nr:oncoprotein-induced transcript 3 protein-like [Dreissena polymorpha]KAH3810313.1 hypothetical protein DPMN_138703 [Dreissena polymorpha]